MTMHYTPGPWTVDECGLNVICSDGSGLNGSRDADEKRANAHLVAASPELLEVLEDSVKELEDRASKLSTHQRDDAEARRLDARIRQARAAIEKARGNSHNRLTVVQAAAS